MSAKRVVQVKLRTVTAVYVDALSLKSWSTTVDVPALDVSLWKWISSWAIMKSQRGFPHWAVRNTLKIQKKALLPHSESPLFFQRALWSCLDAFSFVPHRPMSHRLGAIATSKIGNATGLSFASRYAALQRVCLDSEKAWNLILDSQARMIFVRYLLYHHAPLSLVNPRFNDHLREWHYQRQTGTFFQIWQPPGLN